MIKSKLYSNLCHQKEKNRLLLLEYIMRGPCISQYLVQQINNSMAYHLLILISFMSLGVTLTIATPPTDSRVNLELTASYQNEVSQNQHHPPTTTTTSTLPDSGTSQLIPEFKVTCDSHYIQVKIPNLDHEFSGMVYPQGLSKNSSCLKEYHEVESIEYSLPLRSCNTMMTQSNGIEEEFYNTIILEPHPRLVTGHGKGYQIRCKYKKQLGGDKKNLPIVIMKILRDGKELSNDNHAHVKIGDPLMLNITIESEQRLPFIITDCKVRDGLGWAEEQLVNLEGCSVDNELMGQFEYTTNTATVKFLAHKFPYSPSVYYACAVKICKDCHQPLCDGKINLRKRRRKRREVNLDEPATIEVYDGLYVNEDNENKLENDELRKERKASGEILCFNQRDFALVIAISGLILMIAVIVLIGVLCCRRNSSGKRNSESGGSSIYSGGYTNTAYSHSSR